MLQGLNLIAAVAFQTNRGGVAGQATLGDTETHPTVGAAPAPGLGTRAYRCLVSGSTQTGAGAAIAAGRYSCTLGAGNDDISVASLVIASSVGDATAGSAVGAGFLKVTRTAPSVFEVDIYTAVGGVPALADVVPGGALGWQVNVAWFRLDPA